MATATGKTDKKVRKQRTTARSFFMTFIFAFIIFTVIGTPCMALVGKVSDWKPLDSKGEETLALEEALPVIVDEDSMYFEAFKDSKRVNVLLLGVNGGLTDTIMLASFDTKAKHVDLISIPRDTYYHREGNNGLADNKINAAYRKDPVNTAKAVSEVLMGMPINYYAVIEYKGISNIVDSMGGVPIDIEFDMKYKDPYDTPPLVINIPKGHQVLDGEHAIQFLRYRHGYKEGDLGRVKAQQRFMKSAFKQCLGLNLPKVAGTVMKNVDSDITLGTATKLAKEAIGMSGDSIETYMLPGAPIDKAPWYVIPDAEGTVEMINNIYSIEPKAASDAAVE